MFEAVPVSNIITALISEYTASRQLKGIQNRTTNRELAIRQTMFRLGERSNMANGRPWSNDTRVSFEVKGRKAAPGACWKMSSSLFLPPTPQLIG